MHNALWMFHIYIFILSVFSSLSFCLSMSESVCVWLCADMCCLWLICFFFICKCKTNSPWGNKGFILHLIVNVNLFDDHYYLAFSCSVAMIWRKQLFVGFQCFAETNLNTSIYIQWKLPFLFCYFKIAVPRLQSVSVYAW